MISQHLARLSVLRFIKIGLREFPLPTSNRPHQDWKKNIVHITMRVKLIHFKLVFFKKKLKNLTH